MTTPILERKGFAVAVIDALAAHICVLDKKGVIVAVNRAWTNFGRDNPPVSARNGVGTSYFDVCHNASGRGSEEAVPFAVGVTRVLAGEAGYFELEYPCHSPSESRWFLGTVTPLGLRGGGAVIAHNAITDRKLLELELTRLASSDALTGLPNRRYFEESAALEVERVTRFADEASIVMVDLDHFKAINDEHGHPCGDEALRRFAQTCRRQLRQIDLFARIGGEEFAICLPGTDETGAAHAAEKLRRTVAAMAVRDGGGPLRITASFGVAAIRDSDVSIAPALARADRALYAAKRAGRNCVVRFGTLGRE